MNGRRGLTTVIAARVREARGQWLAPDLTRGDGRVLLGMVMYAGALRSYDYATGHDTGVPLAHIEATAPLWVWAIALGVGVTALAVGAVGRWSEIVLSGHAILFILYLGLAAGLTAEYVARPWLDGVRGVGELAVCLVAHVICGVRTYTERQARRLPRPVTGA